MLAKLFALLAGGAVSATDVVVTNDAEHNALYERGAGAISPHMQLLDSTPKITPAVRAQISQGIRDLDAVTKFNPQNWAAFWIKGKGYQVLGDQKAANTEFKLAFALQTQNPDVAREYAMSCLDLGFGAEAIRATQHAIKISPADAGLQANLALALLIEGKNIEAKQTITKALKMAPDDKISQALQKVIDEVIAGTRPQPKSVAELEKN